MIYTEELLFAMVNTSKIGKSALCAGKPLNANFRLKFQWHNQNSIESFKFNGMDSEKRDKTRRMPDPHNRYFTVTYSLVSDQFSKSSPNLSGSLVTLYVANNDRLNEKLNRSIYEQ